MQPVSAAHSSDPAIFLSCLHVVFPALKPFLFTIFSCPFIMNICFYWLFSAFFDHVDPTYWGCLHTLSNSQLFDFISSLLLSLFLYIISFFSDKKESCYLFNSILYRYFWYWNHFLKSLEAVISSGEAPEESIVLRVLNDDSWEMGNPFWNLVTEVEGTQTRAIYGGAVFKQVIVAFVSEMKKKCSGTLLRLKRQIPVDSKYLHKHPS